MLPVGQVESDVLVSVQAGLTRIFPDTEAVLIDQPLPVPKKAFNQKRRQYSSDTLLDEIRLYSDKHPEYQRVIGIADVDIYVSGLNYVFGEAYTPGHAGLISLWRLKPQFYGEQANQSVFHLRALKEAVHELGHTLGLKHCSRNFCVMHFSNSIFDTDKKQTLYCDQCYLQASIAIVNTG